MCSRNSRPDHRVHPFAIWDSPVGLSTRDADPGPKRGISTGHTQPVTAPATLAHVSQPLGRAVSTSLPGLVASLRPWGVADAHWLPGPTGVPVVWLATTTEAQRRTLEVQAWLPAQVRILLLRAGVPPEDLSGIRVMFDSEQSRAALLDRG